MKHNRILSHLLSGDFAMLPSSYETMLSVVTAGTELSDEEISKFDNSIQEAVIDENIGIMRIDGAMIKRGNMFSQVSGLSSYDTISKQFKALNDNQDVEKIILHITSQGGEVNGLNDLADAIYSSDKETIAYIEDLGASAGYWLASAFDKVYANQTAMIGSIGVIASYRVSEDDTIQIVSSNAPDKNVDVSTDSGKSKVKERLDALESVFIEKVATHRGVSVQDVLSDFGQGGVMIAKDALSSGMIDGVMSYGELLNNVKEKDMTEKQSKLFALLEGEKTDDAKAELHTLLSEYGATDLKGEIDAEKDEEIIEANEVETVVPELANDESASIMVFAAANRDLISFEEEAKFIEEKSTLAEVREFAIGKKDEENGASEDVNLPNESAEEKEAQEALAIAKLIIGDK